MATKDYSYLGVGKIHLKNLDESNAGFVEIGNCSKFNLSVDSEVKRQKDYTTVGGGTVARVDRINSVGINITMNSLSAENIAKAVNGTATSVSAGTVSETAEQITAVLDTLVPLAHLNPSSVVVKDSAGTTTYTAGTDYTVSDDGIIPLSTGTITAGATLKVTYSYAAYNSIQALLESAKNYEVLYVGKNEYTGKEVRVRVWKGRFGPGKELAFLGDDWAELAIEGEALKDTSKGTGTSAYFEVEMAA
jgi:hypothetical protein